MTIVTGKYSATINQNAEGSYFVLITRENQCIPGIKGKHFASYATAVRGANKMLKKAQA